jgi:hypothetical protein
MQKTAKVALGGICRCVSLARVMLHRLLPGASSAHDPRALDAPALLDGGDTVLCQFRGNDAQIENLSSDADTDQAALLT